MANTLTITPLSTGDLEGKQPWHDLTPWRKFDFVELSQILNRAMDTDAEVYAFLRTLNDGCIEIGKAPVASVLVGDAGNIVIVNAQFLQAVQENPDVFDN